MNKNSISPFLLRFSAVRIICIFFLLLPAYLTGQERITVLPQEMYPPDTTTGGKKSSNAVAAYGYLSCWNGSYYSDYYGYFQWSGYSYQCDCSNGYYNVKLTIDGVDYWPGSFYGTSYAGYGCKVGLGPNRSGTCSDVCYEGGTDGKVLWCWYNCGSYWYSLSNNYYWTGGIRPPVSPTATASKYDYRIDLTWNKTTDIPDAEHGYLIKRDGVEIAKVFNGQRTYSDMTLGPNETHIYTIHTIWPDNNSYTSISEGVAVTGTTFDLNLNASVDQPSDINLTWSSLKNIPGKKGGTLNMYKIDRYDMENNKLTTLPWQFDNSTNNYLDNGSSLIPGYLYKYSLRPYPEDEFYPDTAWGKLLPNGRIKGKVFSPSGQGVKNIKVCAVRLDPVPQDTTTTYCAITDTAGTFEINNMYYYLQSKFRVEPSREGHGFDPVREEPTLYQNKPWIDGVVFTDTSVFTVDGIVLQQGNKGLCPVENVGIYVDDRTTPEVFTDEEGAYSFSVGQINEYTIKPKLEGHGFLPAQIKWLVNSDTTLTTFIDTSYNILSGYFTASCNIFIGRAKLGITSGTAGNYCLDTIIMTDPLTGYYEVKLPSRDYEVSVLEFISESPDVENDAVELYFPAMNVDLTMGNNSLDFVYRSSPDLQISGFPEYGCGEYEGVPVIGQGYEYKLEFEVREIFGDNNCLADAGFVIVINNTGDGSEKTDTVWLDGGKANYSFIPGEPNLLDPFKKNLTFIASVDKESSTKSVDVLVVGNRPREQTFTTVSPEIPFMILRDPPGDASYSYLEENTTSEAALRMSAQLSGSAKVWAEIKAGMKFESGFGVSVETEIWGKVRGSLEIGASITKQDEFTLSISNGERFSTSGNPDITGEGGDVFAGSALNLMYALTDVISYDATSCKVNKTVALSMGVTGFATTFIYTDSHIRNVLIPQLTYLRDLYTMKKSDSARIYSDQIDVWRQTLKLNEDRKMESKYIENRSFSSGSSFESFQEIATTMSSALEFSLYVEANVALEAGIDIGGSGVSGGVEIKVRTDFGVGSTLTEMKSKKTGYVLNDNDGNDHFSVDIRKDEVYGTPVFKTISGASSCPWEAGTQPREGVQLVSDIYVANVDDPNGMAVFHLQLGNISQSNEDMFYDLVFDQGSNPDGAVITAGGSPVIGGIGIPYYVVAGRINEATVTVRRGPEAFDYENLMFRLVSGCEDPAIADTVLLDVHFESPCSSVGLSLPQDNWIVSTISNNKLKVKVDNYDRSLLDFIKIQLTPKGTNNWQTVSYLDKADLEPDFTQTTLLLDAQNDGEYDVRALLECNAGRQYSQSVTGIIDRRAPELYGLPEPYDLVLDSGDMIMAFFNEDINCYKLAASQLEVTNLSKNVKVNASIGCGGNTITVIPNLTEGSFEGDTFNVKLSGIEDLQGNASSEPYSWSFVIRKNPAPPADVDTDLDGILNSADNCPWSSNPAQEDMDTDGKGDICDDDLDGDDILNSADNCMKAFNPDQKDVNNDAIGDACQDLTGVLKPEGIEGFQVYANWPNPFAESTRLSYKVPVESHIIIRVFDVVGKEVAVLANRNYKPGIWEITWNSENCSNGIYYCTISAESANKKMFSQKTIKMVKVR